jgi:glycine cleavage system transcriptional repressor
VRRWFILSAIGSDRPGLAAELAKLVLDADANLDDSRMTILGSDFAMLLLCSSTNPESADRLAVGAKQLERDHGLTILLRHLEDGPRPSLPAPEHHLYRVEVAGSDKAGIVAGVCGALAEKGANIAELSTRSRPGPGGAPHYEMSILVEVPGALELGELRQRLDTEADRLVIDLLLTPA